MKKHISLLLTFSLFYLFATSTALAQNYFVSSLATPGAATFNSDKIADGVITLPFTASTETIEIDTNQDATVTSDADWCQASYADKTLTLTVTENASDDARTALLSIRSKDFHPLVVTVKQEARLAFAVISDTHVGNNFGGQYLVKVPRALRNLTSKGRLDALAVVGDLTDHGDTGQYTEFVQIFGNDENFVNPVDNLLFMMGNHDNYNSNGQGNYKNGLKSFNIKNGRQTSYPLHQYKLIKGYPFITISQLAGANNDDNASNGTSSYPSTSVSTLRRYLKQAAEDAPGKPIFIFTHVAPRWTCYSSWGEIEGAAWAMKVLNPILNDYPQAVVFCGHSHYPLGDPRSIHQGANPKSSRGNYYTVINTASTTYSEINPGAVDAGIHPENFKNVTEGMILVEQPNGDIEIRRYDTFRDVEIDPEHRWVLKAPFDGSMFQYADIRDADDNPNNVPLRDGLPAPEFRTENPLRTDVYPTDVTVQFDQATDNECVFRYTIRLLKDGVEVKKASVFSQFYLTTDMPQTLSRTFEGLTPNTEYQAEVVAYDSWDNPSQPLTATFTTPADDAPMPEPLGAWTFDNPDDLLAGTGTATLQGAYHDYGQVAPRELANLSIKAVKGPAEENGAIAVPQHNSLLLNTNINTNSLSTYTFLMDINVPDVNSGYTALYQNDLTNTKDGSLFINKNGEIGKGVAGLGYHGSLTGKNWYRVLFVVRDNWAKVYVDGSLVGQSTSEDAENWLMSTGALFFADNDDTDGVEEHLVNVAEMRFWDKALTASHAIQLGTAIPEQEPVEVTIPEAIGTWTFNNPDNLLEGTGTATLQSTKHSKGSVTACSPDEAGIVATEGPATAGGAVLVPKNSSLLMASNLGVSQLSTYTVLWDVKSDNYAPFTPLLQNSLTNAKDGSLFLNKNMVGLNTGGLGYHGSLVNGNWYRIVFVVENNYATVYVNGERVGQSTQPISQHWQLTTGALFFADEDGEEEAVRTAGIRFWNEALTDSQVKKLGAVPTE